MAITVSNVLLQYTKKFLPVQSFTISISSDKLAIFTLATLDYIRYNQQKIKWNKLPLKLATSISEIDDNLVLMNIICV